MRVNEGSGKSARDPCPDPVAVWISSGIGEVHQPVAVPVDQEDLSG